ncbi:MAG: Nif3-like dinuclear metal center hexameric protein [Firmicutes bacterium]|nr:Nif3-like dinuclear metal center hexameric protein [Bacillota bacterium]
MHQKNATVEDVVIALNTITGGRLPSKIGDLFSGENPFVVIKSSNIPGKEVTEIPGLVFGNPDQAVQKLAVLMTLTETAIELACATGVDAIVAHHPVADAANFGGVTMKNYLGLYGIAVFELHEAFHGLHPGLAYLHGHRAFRVEIAYGGIPGNIMYVGKALPEIKTVGDMLSRLQKLMCLEEEHDMLKTEREVRNCRTLEETSVAANFKVLCGCEDSKFENIIHIFPHTGFTPEHLERAVREHPEADTLLASISRVPDKHPLIEKAGELGLNFVVGNSHAMEIFENGLPLALALQKLLPDTEVLLFRERYTATPLNAFNDRALHAYAAMIADEYLIK